MYVFCIGVDKIVGKQDRCVYIYVLSDRRCEFRILLSFFSWKGIMSYLIRAKKGEDENVEDEMRKRRMRRYMFVLYLKKIIIIQL